MRPLRILITADPYIPVPPVHYGGSERLIDVLVRGLHARGHRVTVVAHPASEVPAELVPYGMPPHWGVVPRAQELWQVGSVLWRRRREVDLIHSCGRLAALLPVLPLRRLPKLQTYQREEVPWKSVATAVRIAGDSIRFAGCSKSVFHGRPAGPRGGRWHCLWNAIELERYRLVAEVPADAPFAFLGRIEDVKGPHHAIAIARAVGRRLLIAGNIADQSYFDVQIAPHLDEQIQYVGPVDDAAKSRLLGQAAALLMPTQFEEPFGLVIVEAMACGTPVIGFARGGVPEIIRDGVNGYLCRDVAQAIAAAGRLDRLDRRVTRADCEARFSAERYVDAHERVYREMVAD